MDTKLLLKLKNIYSSLPGFLQKPLSDIMYQYDIKAALEQFLSEEERNNTRLRRAIIKDIKHCRKIYNTKAVEYFLFGFRNLTHEQRNEFLPDMVKDEVLKRVVGLEVMNREMKDKYNFYKMLCQYFKREAMLIPIGGGNKDDFEEFAQRHNDLFIKCNVLSKGRGAGLYHVETDQEINALYDKLVRSSIEWIVEEKIRQLPEMSQWNESSVNTVRLPAVLNNDVFTVIGPFFRTGRKGSAVDNAGQGGVFACVDPASGILTTDGIDEKKVYYERHPDSGLVYKGWQIPCWQELLSLAEEIHRKIPHHKYVGWDFALTERGWVLIEGNWGQFVSQYNDHIGLKKQFFELLGIEDDSLTKQ